MYATKVYLSTQTLDTFATIFSNLTPKRHNATLTDLDKAYPPDHGPYSAWYENKRTENETLAISCDLGRHQLTIPEGWRVEAPPQCKAPGPSEAGCSPASAASSP